MGMGMNSLKWEGIGTKNLFPHISKWDCGTGLYGWAYAGSGT